MTFLVVYNWYVYQQKVFSSYDLKDWLLTFFTDTEN